MSNEVALEILQLSNDGNKLTPQHLKLIEVSVNHGLSRKGEKLLKQIRDDLKNGKYVQPWFMGVEGMTQDHEAFVYYHGSHVEHYTNRYFENDEAIKTSLIELKKRCELLIENKLEVTSSNAVWLWGSHKFQKEGEGNV